MTASFRHKSAAQIRARLSEIAALEQAHNDRDMDAELHQAMATGADVDALETLQLDADRQARRMRVERTALQAELPLAVKREAKAALTQLLDQHASLAAAAPEKIERVCDAWRVLCMAVDAWCEHQANAFEITEQIIAIDRKDNLGAPIAGPLLSERMAAVCRDSRDLYGRLYSATDMVIIGGRAQGVRID